MDKSNYYNNILYSNPQQQSQGSLRNHHQRQILSHFATGGYDYDGQRGNGFIEPRDQGRYHYQHHRNSSQPINSVPVPANGFGATYVTHHNKRDGDINDEEFSEKLIAYARFNRNTDLIKTILSEVMVPDVRQVVTSGRLKILKDQVQTLENHHKKVDMEVTNMETDYTNKKRSFLESTADYHRDYKKLCRPAVGLKMYHGMVAKYYKSMKEDEEKRRWEKSLEIPDPIAPETAPVLDITNGNSPCSEILDQGFDDMIIPSATM